MKRWFICFVLIVLLCACDSTSKDKATSTSTYKPIANKAVDQLTVKDFHVTLNSAKEVYNVGEKINVTATLENISDAKIQIGYGESWGDMGVVNLTENYQFGLATIEPYTMAVINPGEKVESSFRFSGIPYNENHNEGNAYSQKVYEQMKELTFPKGQYELKLFVNFADLTNDDAYKDVLSIVFTVE